MCFPSNPLISSVAKVGIRPVAFRHERGAIMAADGYSTDCSECVGEFADCIVDHCAAECTAEAQAVDGGEACALCIGPACGMAYADCYAGAEEDGPPPEPTPGLCVDNAQDIAAIAAPGDAISYCIWFICLGTDDDSCMSDCMLSSGFTDPCAACAGALRVFRLPHCWTFPMLASPISRQWYQ